ncbi:MAG: hypothetical protein V1779_11845 [bacterium]
MYINRKIISEQLIIDLPNSMLNREVDIFIIPKREISEQKPLNAKDFVGKLSHLDINDFLENIESQRLEWQTNS